MVATKWNFIPTSIYRLGDCIVGVRLCPAVSVMTADVAVKPVMPVGLPPAEDSWDENNYRWTDD
jgi:hypothetical protein